MTSQQRQSHAAELGATMVEYMLLVGTLALVILGGLQLIGTATIFTFGQVGQQLNDGEAPAPGAGDPPPADGGGNTGGGSNTGGDNYVPNPVE